MRFAYSRGLLYIPVCSSPRVTAEEISRSSCPVRPNLCFGSTGKSDVSRSYKR